MAAFLLARELRCVARARATYVIRGAYLVAVVGLFLAGWYQAADAQRFGYVETAQAGRSLYLLFFGIQYAATFLICPVLVAGAIAEEEENRTLEILLLTPVSRLGLVLAKFGSRMAHVALLVLAGVPVQFGALLLGGVSQEEVLVSSALVLANACWMGAWAILYSATERKGFTAALRAYWSVALWCVAVPMVDFVVRGGKLALPGPEATVLAPPLYFAAHLAGGWSGTAPDRLLGWELALLGGSIAVLLVGAAYRVGRTVETKPPRGQGPAAAKARESGDTTPPGGPAASPGGGALPARPDHRAVRPPDAGRAAVRVGRSLSWRGRLALLAASSAVLAVLIAIVFPVRYVAGFKVVWPVFAVSFAALAWSFARGVERFCFPGRPYAPVWQDHLVWKEMVLPAFPAGRWAATTFVGVLAALTIAGMTDAHTALRGGFTLQYLEIALAAALLVTSMAGGSAIAAEREQGLLDVLLVTPMTPGRFVRAKVCGAFVQAAPLLVFVVALHAACVAAGMFAAGSLAEVPALAFATVALQAALACACSLRLRRSSQAILLALAVPLGLYLLAPILADLATGHRRYASGGFDWTWSPFAQIERVVGAASYFRGQGDTARVQTNTVALVVAGAGAAWGIAAWVARRLRR